MTQPKKGVENKHSQRYSILAKDRAYALRVKQYASHPQLGTG